MDGLMVSMLQQLISPANLSTASHQKPDFQMRCRTSLRLKARVFFCASNLCCISAIVLSSVRIPARMKQVIEPVHTQSKNMATNHQTVPRRDESNEGVVALW